MTHPYEGISEFQNWNRAVGSKNLLSVSPALHSDFKIEKDMKIMSLGSCFAQHITHHLHSLGFTNLFHEFGSSEDHSYRIFSARYGNIYTIKQALQLLRRAYGEEDSTSEYWQAGDRFIDPYRPNAVSSGFDNVSQMISDQKSHLKIVSDLFSTSDVIILTLGLTEGWVNTDTGVVYPIAPGVTAGEYHPEKHRFFNQNVSEVIEELTNFVTLIRSKNSKVNLILTVSPVPLAATFEKMHVINASSYSKSVLRVAAQEAVSMFDFVHYFPSYEMVTSPLGQGSYFEDDFRHIRSTGVGRVMKEFQKVFVESEPKGQGEKSNATIQNYQSSSRIICDEDAILNNYLKPEEVPTPELSIPAKPWFRSRKSTQ